MSAKPRSGSRGTRPTKGGLQKRLQQLEEEMQSFKRDCKQLGAQLGNRSQRRSVSRSSRTTDTHRTPSRGRGGARSGGGGGGVAGAGSRSSSVTYGQRTNTVTPQRRRRPSQDSRSAAHRSSPARSEARTASSHATDRHRTPQRHRTPFCSTANHLIPTLDDDPVARRIQRRGGAAATPPASVPYGAPYGPGNAFHRAVSYSERGRSPPPSSGGPHQRQYRTIVVEDPVMPCASTSFRDVTDECYTDHSYLGKAEAWTSKEEPGRGPSAAAQADASYASHPRGRTSSRARHFCLEDDAAAAESPPPAPAATQPSMTSQYSTVYNEVVEADELRPLEYRRSCSGGRSPRRDAGHASETDTGHRGLPAAVTPPVSALRSPRRAHAAAAVSAPPTLHAIPSSPVAVKMPPASQTSRSRSALRRQPNAPPSFYNDEGIAPRTPSGVKTPPMSPTRSSQRGLV